MTPEGGRPDVPEALASIKLAFCREGGAGEGLPGREGNMTKQPSRLQAAHSVRDAPTPTLQPQSGLRGLPGPIWRGYLHVPHPLQRMPTTLRTRALFSTFPVWGPLPLLVRHSPLHSISVRTMTSSPTPCVINHGSGSARPPHGQAPTRPSTSPGQKPVTNSK